jgi:hypothetical protein
VEQINPYAVMRNTATYEAFKAYKREAMKAGAPFFVVGTTLIPVSISLQGLTEQAFVHSGRVALPLLMAWTMAPAVLCLLFTAIGALRIRQFRREHPIPEEWRQVPRARWPQIRRQPPLA